ncbi:hypothetical protein GCM10009092_16090 [Bowmanella denitrificans]|uniref:histidine kinase n=1 Tax=Bowmanella denitrificans TaxID=366582 RepID=A0ABN0X162_9ALTE
MAANSPAQAADKTDELLQLHQMQLTQAQKIRLLYGKAWFQIQVDDIDLAMQTLAQCKHMSQTVDSDTILFSYYSISASAFSNLAMYQRALENFLESYRIARLMDTEQYVRQTENNIGHIYLKMGRYIQAQEYFQRFYDDAKARELPSQMATGLNNLGEAWYGQQLYQEALRAHQQSLAIREQHQFTYHSSWSHHNLGRTYLALGDIQKAQRHLTLAIQIRQQSNPSESIGPMLDLARIKIDQSDWQSAEPLLTEALSLAQSSQRFQERADAYQLLMRYHQAQENWPAALSAANQYAQSKFDLLNRQAQIGVAFYAAQLDLAAKDNDIARLTQQNAIASAKTESARQQMLTLIVAVTLVGVITLLFIARIRAKNQQLSQTLQHLKSTQRKLADAEKMSAMTTLVSGMAHQLNTPLGLVITSVSTLKDRLSQTKEKLHNKQLSGNQLSRFLEEADEILALTNRNTERAADMIARFKLISTSLESSEMKHFDVVGFLNDRLQLLKRTLNKDVDIVIQGEPVEIYSYPDVLFKAISQLLENSCEHGFSQQQAAQVSIRVIQSGKNLTLVYQDNGSGISKDKQKHIFNPFYTSQLGKGNLGLGLNILYNAVVHILGGEVYLEPTDSGACFVIVLPLKINNHSINSD